MVCDGANGGGAFGGFDGVEGGVGLWGGHFGGGGAVVVGVRVGWGEEGLRFWWGWEARMVGETSGGV